MSKLAWVLLPLLLAGAALLVSAWRRRTPSRLGLNVIVSLLLMAYVLTTAGLGIFWVANQQLPVFDWHYLFGYATVLLVALHLGFNFRTVWAWLLRRRAVAPDVRPGTATARRPLLGAMGLLGAAAASGAAFLLGLRHGRTELRIDSGVAGDASAGSGLKASPAVPTLAVVEQFHAFSAHSRTGVLRRAPSVDWGDPPPPFKTYPGRPRLALPPPARRPARGGRFDIVALGGLLWHTAGVSERRGTLALRTAPSSGALFSTELYLAVRAVDGVTAGLWHYDASSHALEQVGATALSPPPIVRRGETAVSSPSIGQPGETAVVLDAASLGVESLPAEAAAIVIATAVFRRSGHKYRDRTYRYVLADLGHALENLRVAAAALGGAAALLPAFDEARVARTLGIDEAEEGVLALVVIGPAGMAAEGPRAARTAAGRSGLAAPPPARTDAPAGVAEAPLGVTDAVHRATSLRGAAASAPSSAPRPAPAGADRSGTAIHVLRQAAPAAADPLAVIARRRSVRRFAERPLPQADLAALLAAMTGAPPRLSDAVRIDVVTTAVDGLERAAWRYAPAPYALHRRVRHGDDVRRRARAAALDQDVVGDAAAVIVLSIAREAFAADPAGAARGYRHAYIEAGLVGERVYLEGGARGLGVCAVGAFYDVEAAALVGIDPVEEWVVHLAAVGWPA